MRWNPAFARPWRSTVLVAFAVTSWAPAAQAGPTLSAVRAKLVKPLDAHAQKGESFFVNTMAAWQQGNCKIRANTMVEGQIAGWERKKDGARQEELGVRFEPLSCYGSETLQVTPVLVALRGPLKQLDDAGLGASERKQAMMSTMANRAVQQPGNAGGSTNAGRAAESAENRTIAGAGKDEYQDTSAFETGEVRNVRSVKMVLPVSGPEAVTKLISTRRIELPVDTQFFLAFVGLSGRRETGDFKQAPKDEEAASTADSAQIAAQKILQREESASAANQKKLCAAGCSELDATPATTSAPGAWSLSLAHLGFRPRPGQVRVDLDDDASVHFLGDEEILVTFNTHSLTPRPADAGDRPRRIRALLLSGKDGHILQTEEWTVFDDRQYTWDLGDGRVLAHVGRELLIYEAGLVIQKRYKVAGPVVFAEVAPPKSGADGLIAVATMHEKHTPEGHRKLASFLGPDRPIEEDYDLTMLNSNLEPIGTKNLDARPDPVAILSTGMVSAERTSGQKWKLQQLRWDGKTETLAELRSACNIGVTSLPAQLLFATTCAADQSATYYWILNAQGSVLLAGHAAGTELVQEAQSSAAGDVVAIATSESYQPIDLKVGARIANFNGLTVSAYRTADGRKILSAKTAQGSALRETFALAPAGGSLAILTGSTLQAYALLTKATTEKILATEKPSQTPGNRLR